jgi:hypothetical protein
LIGWLVDHVLLLQPRARPPTNEQIAQAVASVRVAIGHTLVETAAYFSSEYRSDLHLAKLIATQAVVIRYRDIANFPVISASGRSGGLFFSTTFSNKRILCAIDHQREGLSCEEAVFLSLFFAALGVKYLFVGLSGGMCVWNAKQCSCDRHSPTMFITPPKSSCVVCSKHNNCDGLSGGD